MGHLAKDPVAFNNQLVSLAELLQHDPQAAFARVRDAAQAGQVEAQLLLAQMHMEGKGTAQDASAAL